MRKINLHIANFALTIVKKKLRKEINLFELIIRISWLKKKLFTCGLFSSTNNGHITIICLFNFIIINMKCVSSPYIFLKVQYNFIGISSGILVTKKGGNLMGSSHLLNRVRFA